MVDDSLWQSRDRLACLSEKWQERVRTSEASALLFSVLLPGLFNQKLPNEVLGQLAGLAEEFLIKVVTHCCDICQRFLLRVSQKGGCSTEAGHREGMCDCRKGDGSGGDGFRDLDSYGCMGIGGSPQSFGGGGRGQSTAFQMSPIQYI